MRTYSTMQQLLCNGGYCDFILSLARTSYRLLFTARPTARPLAGNPLRDVVRSRNPSKSTLAHDAVATVVLHKHHPIICVGAGLIQFVYRSHLRLATGATRNRNAFSPFFPRVFCTSISRACAPFFRFAPFIVSRLLFQFIFLSFCLSLSLSFYFSLSDFRVYFSFSLALPGVHARSCFHPHVRMRAFSLSPFLSLILACALSLLYSLSCSPPRACYGTAAHTYGTLTLSPYLFSSFSFPPFLANTRSGYDECK